MQSSFPLAVKHPRTVRELFKSIGNCQMYGKELNTIIQTVASPDSSRHDSLVFLKHPLPESVTDFDLAAAAVVCNQKISFKNVTCQIVTKDPLSWFISALHILCDLDQNPSISPTAIISPSAKLGKNINIGERVIIEDDCYIGEDSSVGSNALIKSGTHIGKNCFIQANTVIGGVGLGYHFTDTGKRLFFPHLGNVIIEDNVVIGSSCVIVRGQLKDTILKSGVRIGNLVNIGHNVIIGSNSAISSSCLIAGGAQIGSGCNIAAGVTVNAKISIGDKTKVGLGSVVTKTLPSDQSFFGYPAKRLPTMGSF